MRNQHEGRQTRSLSDGKPESVYSATTAHASSDHTHEGETTIMYVRRYLARRLVGGILAGVTLLALAGCAFAPALSKADLDSGKLSEKHPKLSAEKEKAGCRSCHREQAAAKAAQ
jgi:hypothetical protein